MTNIIEVSFGGGSIAYVKVDTAYFYNSGIIFKPTDIELPTSYQVHWADSPQASSTLETIGTAEGAPIPDDLWNRSRVIYGWIYLHPTNDSSITGYEVRIYKNVRAGLPDGTEPTPAEQSTIDQLIGALNSAVEQTGEDVESAQASATQAQGYAEQAETAKNDAQTYASNAGTSATSASNSATSASQSATASANSASASAQIKADIEDMVESARGYANTSATNATSASRSADQAESAATNAATFATNAVNKAVEAAQSANTASTKASEASISAQTASQKATESAQSASQALTYKTDAESAKTASQTAQGLAESARDTAVSAKTDAENARDDAESARDEAQQAVASISGALAEKAPVITDTASGSIASFSDGADDLPLKSLVVDINPIQDGTGDPSPDNVRPISGWTEVGVEQSGKNIYDIKGWLDKLSVPYTESNGYVSFTPTSPCYSSFFELPSGTKTLSFEFGGESTATNIRFRVKYANGTIDANATAQKTGDIVGVALNWSSVGTIKVKAQIEFGSTATSYEPYTGRSITIDLGQTVYSGKLDVLTGELVVDRAIVDLGTLTWSGNAQRYALPRWNAVVPNMSPSKTSPYSDGILCSQYAPSSIPITTINVDKTIARYNGNIYVCDSAYTTASDFKSAMSGVQLCYELAEPIEIQLSANQINSLLGVNNIWADTGDTTCEYRADTKLFIERLTAPDSADMVADANITSGKYFMVGNSLYKATANIANGSAIVVGTNCTRKSLSEALNEINA